MSVDLGIELKRAFQRWCDERSLVPSRVVRELVEKAVAAAGVEGVSIEASKPPPEPLRTTVAPVEDAEPRVRREIQLTASEDAAVAAACAREQMSIQAFVIAAVRAALAGSPTFGQAQLEALGHSNRLLHQVLQEHAEARHRGVTLDGQAWTDLELMVRGHVSAAAALMAQGAQRWQLRTSN